MTHDVRDLYFEVERFLVEEAALLDDHRHHEWLDRFTDDAHYWMPVSESVEGEPADAGGRARMVLPIIDDDKPFLVKRVQRLDTGLAHCEEPRSRTRHLIGGIRLENIAERDGHLELTALSNFIVFQSRLEESEHFFVGRREDRLVKRDGGWKIARRHVWLDQALLPRALSTLF